MIEQLMQSRGIDPDKKPVFFVPPAEPLSEPAAAPQAVDGSCPLEAPKQAPESPQVASDDLCGVCGGVSLWQTHGGRSWLCTRCQPPPLPSMIERTKLGGIVNEAGEGEGAAKTTHKPPKTTPDAIGGGSEGEAGMVSLYVLTACVPACRACLSCWYTETTWSDGSTDLECYCCKAKVTGEVYPNLAAERRAERDAKLLAEDAAAAATGD